jgi:hypothetical protein
MSVTDTMGRDVSAPPADDRATFTPRPADPGRAAGADLPTRKIGLGEELPIFCEKCGYALHGLPQTVCDHCAIRQFHCPECAHHQPINTLRPAAQKVLGRIRSFFLALSILFKLNFFGWLLFAWVAMGVEWSYQYQYDQAYARTVTVGPGGRTRVVNVNRPAFTPREVDLEQMLAFTAFGLAFGMVGRMLLLRWRRGYQVGLTLGALAAVAVAGGGYLFRLLRNTDIPIPPPMSGDWLITLATTAVSITLGATIVWGVWTALAHVFLPKRTAQALLDWQRSLSNPPAAQLARE